MDKAFDLLTNIIDHWDSDLRHRTLASDWNESVRRALLNAAMLGKTRVAIYGAGTHTRAVGEALMEPGVEIVCLIDDDARRHGARRRARRAGSASASADSSRASACSPYSSPSKCTSPPLRRAAG